MASRDPGAVCVVIAVYRASGKKIFYTLTEKEFAFLKDKRDALLMSHTSSDVGKKLDAAFWGCCLYFFCMIFAAYWRLPFMEVFGNDEPQYYGDMAFKLREDGRWINFLILDTIKLLPSGFWAAVNVPLLWVGFFILFYRFVGEKITALCMASVAIISHPMVELLLWPTVAFPTVAIFVFLAALSRFCGNYRIFYLIFGLLICGVNQSFYFISILFFSKDIANFNKNQKNKDVFFVATSHIFWWFIGFLVGFVFMSTFNYAYIGVFGVEIAAWRDPKPIRELGDLGRNLIMVAEIIKRELIEWFGIYIKSQTYIILAMVTLLFWGAFWAISKNVMILSVISLVFLSFFSTSIITGVSVDSRSLISVSFAIMCLGFILSIGSVFLKVIYMFLLVIFAFHGAVHASNFYRDHSVVHEFFIRKIQIVIPSPLSDYNFVALSGSMSGTSRIASIFNTPSWIHPVVMAMGAREYRDCRQDQRCYEISGGVEVGRVSVNNGILIGRIIDGGGIFLVYQEK